MLQPMSYYGRIYSESHIETVDLKDSIGEENIRGK
jgi:hypothetical protein